MLAIFVTFAILCLAGGNIMLTINNRTAVRSLHSSKQNLIESWGELSRCQKANSALRERVGTQRYRVLDLQQKLERALADLKAAQAAAQQPLPVDPDQEPTFAEIVTEVASHVSSLTTSIPVVEGSTAPEPVQQQVVAGMVVTTPNGFDVNATDITDDSELLGTDNTDEKL